MAAYNFQARFVPKVLAGTKRHTIRATRKRPTKVGETLHLFTGQRTKKCKLLMRVPCVKVESIEISEFEGGCVSVDGIMLDPSERERLAWADGFASFKAMLEFWEGRLPFYGDVIHWSFPKKGKK